MALTLRQSVHTYSSSSGGQEYLFDVIVDGQGLVSVRNIRSPNGLIQDTYTSVPQVVVDDMTDAVAIVKTLALEAEVDSGQIVFDGDTEVDVVIPGGVLNNTNYRVEFTPPDAIRIIATNKTITGFTAEAASAYGTLAAPKTVGYSVLVATVQASTLSGVVSLVPADNGQKTVTFAQALATDAYRVVLEERGFFDARILSQTKKGFTVQIGHTLPVGGQADIGYDVFV